jgi:hypothetical protein
MSISRRDFMKLVGVSVASLSVTRCHPTTQLMPTPTIAPTARDLLRLYWLSFGELAQATIEEFKQVETPGKTTSENAYGNQLVSKHRLALDVLVSSGELTPAVADLVQEAYAAAVYHVWRSNAPMTCYVPVMVDYAPASANTLVQQASVLNEVAGKTSIDPVTLEKARAAIEHDMAFYALTDVEVKTLYDSLIAQWQSQQQGIPAFENVDLEATPDAKAAAKFIIGLLTRE